MHENEELITSFYRAFAAGDHETMAAAYSDEATFSVRLALILFFLFRLPFLLAIVPLAFCLKHDANAATFDRLTEEISGTNLDLGLLSRQIKRAVGLNSGHEIRQIIPADLDSVESV